MDRPTLIILISGYEKVFVTIVVINTFIIIVVKHLPILNR